MKIILASTSPNRKALLDRMSFEYKISVPDFEEIVDEQFSNKQNIKNFAVGKAKSVYPKFEKEKNILIFGFDSMIEIGDIIIGKPTTKKSAFEMIQSFIGKTQKVTTGISVIGNFKGKYFEKTDIVSTTVKFKKNITNCQIRKYLEFGDWSGKCGAYSILGMGQFFIEKIDGDFQNIIGIPVLKMGEIIEEITGKNPITIFEPIKQNL